MRNAADYISKRKDDVIYATNACGQEFPFGNKEREAVVG
jgi:hypothetical protein